MAVDLHAVFDPRKFFQDVALDRDTSRQAAGWMLLGMKLAAAVYRAQKARECEGK